MPMKRIRDPQTGKIQERVSPTARFRVYWENGDCCVRDTHGLFPERRFLQRKDAYRWVRQQEALDTQARKIKEALAFGKQE